MYHQDQNNMVSAIYGHTVRGQLQTTEGMWAPRDIKHVSLDHLLTHRRLVMHICYTELFIGWTNDNENAK